MKNLIFGLFATLLFAFNGNAQTAPGRVESAVLKVKDKGNVTTQYKFTSIKDFSEGSTKIFDELSRQTNAEECTMTIEMSVTVTISAAPGGIGGSISTTVTGSVTTSCAGAVAAAKKLRTQLIAIAQG